MKHIVSLVIGYPKCALCYLSGHYFIVQGTVDIRVYHVEVIHSCTVEML